MENPLRTYWKVRKWFRIPKPSIYFGPIISGLPCRLPNKWMPEARIYTYRFLKLRGYKNNNPSDSGLREVIDDVAQYITKLSLES